LGDLVTGVQTCALPISGGRRRDGEGSGQAGRNVAPTPGGACASQPRRGAVQCRTMKFGWMTLSLSPTPAEDLASVHQQLDQGVFAEAMGFDYLWLTEHNFTGECAYADPIPFAGALAARTSRVRIGFAVIEMALHHPVRLAIQLAV